MKVSLASHIRLSNELCPSSDCVEAEMRYVPYASVVGCLMYCMVFTRPDIASAVSLVSRFMLRPGEEHWLVLWWIL